MTATKPRETTGLADLPEVLKVQEAANYLRVSKHTLYAEIEAGRLPVIRLSHRVWRLSKFALEKWLEAVQGDRNE